MGMDTDWVAIIRACHKAGVRKFVMGDVVIDFGGVTIEQATAPDETVATDVLPTFEQPSAPLPFKDDLLLTDPVEWERLQMGGDNEKD